jgi:hypothetical protein
MADSSHEHAFAAELARCGDLPLLLLEGHCDDGTGHCEVCPAGADGSGRRTHPCNVRCVAVEALAIQARWLSAGYPDVVRFQRGSPARPAAGGVPDALDAPGAGC